MIDIAIGVLKVLPSRVLSGSTNKHDTLLIEQSNDLLAKESFLRRNAYKNSSITTDTSFYDDSDMISDYNLIVVYDKISDIPLLSGITPNPLLFRAF
jgi:hypothetical protein